MDSPELERYFDLLYPINRSITGKGFTDSLDILSELIPLQKHYWKSGERVHDWIIPDEWNCCSGAIWREDNGEVIIDFKDCNLHVVGYSESVSGVKPWWDLRRFVHTVPELFYAVPYITSYFKRSWGFCMTHKQYLNLDKHDDVRYCYRIDSSLKPGKLVVGDLVVPGESPEEIFLSTYLCHPSMANNELSGPLVLAGVYQRLKEMKLHHTLRFIVNPENIGMVAYLSRFGRLLKRDMKAGLVVNCVGLGPEYTYKKARTACVTDIAANNVLRSITKEKRAPWITKGFIPNGSDERQLCSPGYDLPVGVFMRRGYWDYKEYHTSLDNKDLISFDTMLESIDAIVDIVLTIDKNRVYRSSVQYGTPMFARHPDGEKLYQSTMKLNNFYRGEGHRAAMLEVINSSDGETHLLSIAERYGRRMLDYLPVVDMLVEAGYLK